MYDLTGWIKNESGAVTVDWVVLTAAVTGLGLGSTALVRSGVVTLGGDVETSLSGAQVAQLSFTDDPTDAWDLSAFGYRDIGFYFFTDVGVNNWYNNNVANLSDDELLAALETRLRNMESELAMGPDDAPSYGEPWGHTDMYNLTLWEAKRRGLV